MTKREELAKTIVSKILENLHDRRGFKYLLDDIEIEDPDTYTEIKDQLEAIVLEVIPL